MENLSALANSITSQKPELELTQVWGGIMRANNVPLNSEESEKVQSLVVDAYYGIKQKLGRKPITSELITGALNEASDFIQEISGALLSAHSEGFADGLQDLMKQAAENGGSLDLGGIQINIGSAEELKEVFEGAFNQNKGTEGGKIVEMPKNPKPKKKAVEEPETV